MPELPEVETICRGLESKIKNLRAKKIKILNPKLRIPIPKNLNNEFKNKKIIKVQRKAKYVLIEFENDLTLIIHLGMSGRVLINQDEMKSKHNHLVIIFDDGSKLIYNDTRKFGLITYSKTSELNQHKLFCKIGVEPFSVEFSAGKLSEIFSKRKKSSKSVLMDASLIVGIGNIYASEILFRAKIHPETLASKLDKKAAAAIHKYTIEVLNEAIAAGGSTLKDYVHTNGKLGYFQKQFLVYNRAGKPCLHCKSEIQRIVQNGRSSYYCLKCQKL